MGLLQIVFQVYIVNVCFKINFKKKEKKKKKKKKDPLIIPVLCTSPRSIANPPGEPFLIFCLLVLNGLKFVKMGLGTDHGRKKRVREGVRHVTDCVSKVKLYASACILVFERRACGKNGPKDAK